jgi:hypothetical protein
MKVRYEDALQEALDARGEDSGVQAVIERYPEHAEALREDLELSGAIGRAEGTVTSPRAEIRANALLRLQDQLDTERRATQKRRTWPFGGLQAPRFAIAAAVVALAVLGAGLLFGTSGSTVQAATIDGVVVENSGDSLTVQTLDSLEQVTVPPDAKVADVAGATVSLGAIQPGQMVTIKGQRRNQAIVAAKIQRYADSIEAWCSGDAEQCQHLSDSLEKAAQACQHSLQACAVARDRIEALRQRAIETLRIERLKQACRDGNRRACVEVLAFCRLHDLPCSGLDRLQPTPTTEPGASDAPVRTETPADTATPQPARTDAIESGPAPTATPSRALSQPTVMTRDPGATATPAANDARPNTSPLQDAPAATEAPSRPDATTAPVSDRGAVDVTRQSGPSRGPTAAPAGTDAPVQTRTDGASDGR